MSDETLHDRAHDTLAGKPTPVRFTLAERQKALEDSFFHKRDGDLLEKLRRQLKLGDRESALIAASGIRDRALLSELAEHGMNPEMIAAVGLVPLVEVAWADGGVSSAERSAVLKAAEGMGVSVGGAAHDLLRDWLEQPPDEEVEIAWRAYVKALAATLSQEQVIRLRAAVMDRALLVARAAGGILGMGGKVSVTEQAALDRLGGAFR